MPVTEYSASWSRSLKVTTAAVTALLVAIVLVFMFAPNKGIPGWLLFLLATIPLSILLGCVATMVCGYRLEDGALLVCRPGRTTRIALRGLLSASLDSRACQDSTRVNGNGGVYSYSGWYHNAVLGTYELFATDMSRTVVLKLPNRTVVITPNQPEEFVSAVLGGPSGRKASVPKPSWRSRVWRS